MQVEPSLGPRHLSSLILQEHIMSCPAPASSASQIFLALLSNKGGAGWLVGALTGGGRTNLNDGMR